MSLAGMCRMINDKCKNDNIFTDQVLALLMFSNGRECEPSENCCPRDMYFDEKMLKKQILMPGSIEIGKK